MGSVKDGVHQRLMDEAYDLRGRPENAAWDRRRFLMELDRPHRDAVVLGNLNYQVCNGGFSQFYDNGYLVQSAQFLAFAQESMRKTPVTDKVASLVFEAQKRTKDLGRSKAVRASKWGKDPFASLDDAYYGVNEAFLHECEAYLSGLLVERVMMA